MKVLIADDTQIIRDRLVRQISPLPGVSRTYQSNDYDSTLKNILKYKPDVVLLDMFMPGGTGLDVLLQLNERRINCRKIVLTSSPDAQLRSLCMDAGADHYFLKSTDFLSAIHEIGVFAAKNSGNNH